MPLESSSDAPVITRPQHLEQLPAGRLPGLVEHRVVRHVVPPVRLSGPYGRNIDELGGVSMSPVPSAQPVTVCCHRLRPTPGDAAKIKVLQVSKPVSEREMLFW